MPSPALDSQPDNDTYTDHMTNAFGYIHKGCTENGTIPISEIHAFYMMFEDDIVENKSDFIYLIHVMNGAVLDEMKTQQDKYSTGK